MHPALLVEGVRLVPHIAVPLESLPVGGGPIRGVESISTCLQFSIHAGWKDHIPIGNIVAFSVPIIIIILIIVTPIIIIVVVIIVVIVD